MTNSERLQMRIEPEVAEAIKYLKQRGYSVQLRIKTYLIQLAEKDKEHQQHISKNTTTSSDILLP